MIFHPARSISVILDGQNEWINQIWWYSMTTTKFGNKTMSLRTKYRIINKMSQSQRSCYTEFPLYIFNECLFFFKIDIYLTCALSLFSFLWCSTNNSRFSVFAKTGGEAYLLGAVAKKGTPTEGGIRVVVSQFVHTLLMGGGGGKPWVFCHFLGIN